MPAKQKIGNSQGPLKVSKYPIWTWSLISGLTLIVGYIVLLLLGPKLFNLSQYEKKSFYKYSYQHGFLERTVGKGMDNQPKKSKLALYLEEKQFYPRLFNETQMRSVIDNKTVQLILDAQMESEYLFENEEAMRFVQKRNHWRKKSVTKGVEESADSLVCKNCAINIQCYNANFSLWHPAKCPRLKQYSPENIYLDEKCFNLSMMLIGDSRARMLYAAVLRRYYPDWKLVSR